MHPILFEAGGFTIYTYGFYIAVGASLGFAYMARQGKKQFGFTFDQANTLFILLVTASVIGGKVFLIFENPEFYLSQPKRLVSGSGFVFYGSLLFAIPTMLWYFHKSKIPILGMLDIMAVVTGLVHGLGRIGCFMAGCCYGLPTTLFPGVVFTDERCQAEPLNTPLHPTQLYEAGAIFLIVMILWLLRSKRKFEGQLFLLYMIMYAIVRALLEMLRGDVERGFIAEGLLSHSQFISLLVAGTALLFYVKLNRRATLPS